MRFIRFTGSRHAGRAPGSVVCSQEDPRINCGILVANLGGFPEVSRIDAFASHSSGNSALHRQRGGDAQRSTPSLHHSGAGCFWALGWSCHTETSFDIWFTEFLQGCGLNDRFLVMECPGTFAGREPHPESQTDCHIHRYCENGDLNAYLVQQRQLAWPLMVKILAQAPWFC